MKGSVMLDDQEKRVGPGVARRPETPVDEGALLERTISDSRTMSAPAEPSLLQPQQTRNTIWRWHVRRRPRRR